MGCVPELIAVQLHKVFDLMALVGGRCVVYQHLSVRGLFCITHRSQELRITLLTYYFLPSLFTVGRGACLRVLGLLIRGCHTLFHYIRQCYNYFLTTSLALFHL